MEKQNETDWTRYKIKETNTLKIDVEVTPDKIVETLLKDVATVKEAFIIDELQKYMDLTKNPPTWVEPVRLRLQEKEDWKREVKQVIEKLRAIHFKGMEGDEPDSAMHNGAYIALGDLLLELKL
jgi:hypothetical protein